MSLPWRVVFVRVDGCLRSRRRAAHGDLKLCALLDALPIARQDMHRFMHGARCSDARVFGRRCSAPSVFSMSSAAEVARMSRVRRRMRIELPCPADCSSSMVCSNQIDAHATNKK